MLIGDLLQRRARISPETVYWEGAAGRCTYAQLNGAVNRLAHALRAEGWVPGTIVGIHADGGLPYAVVHFAAAKAGLVLAHLNPRYTPTELAWAVNHCGCRALFFGGDPMASAAEARAESPGVKHWIALDGDDLPDWAVALEGWSAGRPESDPAPPDWVKESSPFQLLYTSGTTGYPKGALISHRSKLQLGTNHGLNLGLRPGDRVLSSLPMHHHYAQWLCLTAVPLVGATVVHHPRFDVAATWKALAQDGITHLPGVPTTLTRLLAGLPAAAGSAPPAPALRHVVYGGAPVQPALIPRLRAAFPAARLLQGFGQTETGSCLVLHDADHEHRPDSLGRPDIFSEIRLLDEEGREVPRGEVGEIVARTPYLMNGYYGNPEATAEYFHFGEDRGRTGDLAWQDEEGYFFLAGRKQELIITGGVNVYPAEVERVLLAHPAVREAAVYGTPHPDWGEAVTAAVILHGSDTNSPAPSDSGDPGSPGAAALPGAPGAAALPSEAELTGHCRQSLAPYKCPKSIRILDDFPRNAAGKVLKRELG
ncbi:MAG: class I adenylate-forming enzyme family protein [SAR324 cluster bacterium]|nr:class I adenylate-forming enzyme family protein [SAR324 cluster bacterium]